MTQHANNYSRMFEECAEERDHLAQCLKFARTTMAVVANNANLRGVEHRSLVAEVKRIEAALSAGKEVEAPGPASAVKLCVACRTLHPLDHFDKAAPDFPTRDGLNCNCRKSVAERGYRLMRLPNGKVEPRP